MDLDAGKRLRDGSVGAIEAGSGADSGARSPDANSIGDADTPRENAREVTVAIAKWFGNHAAAISLGHDTGSPESYGGATDLVFDHGLRMDFELVTSRLTDEKLAYMRRELIPRGFGFFGHGQEHVNHDTMTYEEALASATDNFDTMEAAGLAPVSFAYPGGHGFQGETQRAIEAAGFLSARGHSITSNPYIVPNDVLEPHNWFLLPDLVMESYDYMQTSARVNDTSELILFLDGAIDRTAWIILTYHAIGNVAGFGFYDLDDFVSDLDAISERDFWPANQDAATLYVRERLNAQATVTWHLGDGEQVDSIEVYLQDDLPNDRYVQPLTLLFEVPAAWVGVPLAIEDAAGRWPDQVASSTDAALSFVPAEGSYRVTLASTPFVPPDPPKFDAGTDNDNDAGL